MNYLTLSMHLRLFIDKQEHIASLWDGKTPGNAEDAAHTASGLIELAQPLLDTLKELMANEDFVPSAK
jgi:hypothetical protein